MTEIEREDAPLDELVAEAIREISALQASVSRRQSEMRSEQLRLRTHLANTNFALERLASALDMVAVELSQPEARVREVVARWGADGAALTVNLTRLLAALEKTQQYIGLQRLRKKPLLEKQIDRLDRSAGRICSLRDLIDAARY